MSTDGNNATPAQAEAWSPDLPCIKTDNTELIRRAGLRSLRATIYWTIGSFLCLFIGGPIIAIAVLIGAILQLKANYKWLAMTKVLDESERRRWLRRVHCLAALVAFVALVHIAHIVLFAGVIVFSVGQ